MTIFTRDLSHQIVICVILPLLFFQLLPYVACQQSSESTDPDSTTKVTAQSVIGIILLSMFLLSIVGCCLFYAFHDSEIEARSHVVLHTRPSRGLEKNVIESFPFFLYSEVKGLKIGKGGVECAICLNEFEDKETLRWMPPCSHTFHADCIDVWLSSRSTCPVCRATLSLKPGESFPYPSMDVETGNAQRGHSLVKVCENLERFTLQLPEEVRREIVSLNLIRRSHIALPQARSSRQGYRSGSVGSERSGFSQGRQTLRRAISMSFSLQASSVRSTRGKDVRDTSQDSGERSFQRLMP
ncbi:putative RING-H2 finger protein ATL37 isoform X2 [Eutrema salsugineum]|uniref:putative RING-H2 finger protein ATL37 isoform X2 n=1 Tax=Eutrema salsugineum TaxID=72664 RepID=UPI000CED6023|nr:putative RING-H2 finger protein ATL37 isoform X2 [Eutrema salsugineum]